MVLEKREADTPAGGVQILRLRGALEATYEVGSVMLRPFGVDERDLYVDFKQPCRPALVTDIVECCATATNGSRPDRNLLWELDVSSRVECLLRIISLGGAFAQPLPLRCLNEACGETIEVEVSLDDFLEVRDDQSSPLTIDCDGQTFKLRRPNGLDQLHWGRTQFESERSAIEAMVETLIVPDDSLPRDHKLSLDANTLSTVERLLQESDSLINFTIEVVCPYCENTSELELDLEVLAIEYLHRSQRKLLAMVHDLARHYHWSEQEIFAVPHWRRVHYLRLLEDESG
jgi:hypothetical protein